MYINKYVSNLYCTRHVFSD